jgi:putative transposase
MPGAEFVPFLDFPVELRKIAYTAKAIESINFELRKITKKRGHLSDKGCRDAVVGSGAE